MCKFKSGIITRKGVTLAPIYNDSHSDLLRKMNIEDTRKNAMRTFVRAELIPPNNDKTVEVSKWNFRVDQDIVPSWYEKDPQRYEIEFREAVEEWMKEHFTVICGELCVKIKEDKQGTYYMLADILFKSEFGKNNNYAESYVREKLQTCDFTKKLKEQYGENLVPISTNLFSMDGFDDYGTVEGDILALRTFDLNRECRKNIPNADDWEWLSTPNSTPSGYCSGGVRCVGSSGSVYYGWCGYSGGVRPFFILKSSILESCKEVNS